jgi:hypothetical protein
MQGGEISLWSLIGPTSWLNESHGIGERGDASYAVVVGKIPCQGLGEDDGLICTPRPK